MIFVNFPKNDLVTYFNLQLLLTKISLGYDWMQPKKANSSTGSYSVQSLYSQTLQKSKYFLYFVKLDILNILIIHQNFTGIFSIIFNLCFWGCMMRLNSDKYHF